MSLPSLVPRKGTQAWIGICTSATSQLGWHLVLSLSSSVIPLHCTVHKEALAILDLPLLFKLLASHSMGNEMAWPRFTVAIWANWLRSLEQSWRDGNSWQSPGIHIKDPSGLEEPTESQSHPILPALSTNVLHPGAQEPSCWVQEWPCPLPKLCCPCSSSICGVCTGLQPLLQTRERLYLLEFNKVCPWPPRFIEGHPPWRWEGSGQGQVHL